MHSAFIVLAALAAAVFVEGTDVQVFQAGPTTLPLHAVKASVVNANAVATTLAIKCEGNVCTPGDHCGLCSPFTITQGPSTYSVSAVYSASVGGVEETHTVVQDCDITSSTELATCTLSAKVEVSALGRKTATSSSATVTFHSDDIWYTPVLVTAGAEKLTASRATQSVSETTQTASTATQTAGNNDAVAVNAAPGNMGLGQVAVVAVAAAAIGLW
ncbi:hypothetical protein KXX16_008225 [Aspergillus fumigatus]|uniref:GPI anchored cell wall protein, putative n=2 Tax=Aspergillus fumigatus TaxID=746128 RepID=B0XX03_ASPFC|nr:GPI anchored cell wall protein, putative [Aspergillus fumigatus A1163]KAF4260657.1 hypothetical protein CNMCM8714_001043 [Aspergillus fumigatus]KMK58745.1 GPI anchored cell wall protein, putative [Aspergillus fumigatus Z5]KAF4262227.1 hypothetical protein CNMCM8057_001510 [Aspergillus fumigatus]KAF4270990.1 hypothetical protein CNMCM8812_000821 [Aspergillus fumigatus]